MSVDQLSAIVQPIVGIGVGVFIVLGVAIGSIHRSDGRQRLHHDS